MAFKNPEKVKEPVFCTLFLSQKTESTSSINIIDLLGALFKRLFKR
jgi:hypothetical protein